MRTRVFSGGIPILCWGIGAGAKEEEDKENLITFPILLSADLRHQPTTRHKCFRQIENPKHFENYAFITMRFRNQKINVNHTFTKATQLKRTFPGLQILADPARLWWEVEGLARQIGAALEATTEAWHGSNLANPVLEDCKSRDPIQNP